MKKLTLILALLALTGCSHTGISDLSLLDTNGHKNMPSELKPLPIKVSAATECSSYTSGNYIHTYCSNKERLESLVKLFAENGYLIQKSKNLSDPEITIEKDKSSAFINGTSLTLCLFSLGIIPYYHSDDYIITYNSPSDNVNISKKFTLYTTSTWFNALRSNPEDLTKDELRKKAEENLIRKVLNEANL
ncbi:hypothetical protein [Photobacterium sp. R1]